MSCLNAFTSIHFVAVNKRELNSYAVTANNSKFIFATIFFVPFNLVTMLRLHSRKRTFIVYTSLCVISRSSNDEMNNEQYLDFLWNGILIQSLFFMHWTIHYVSISLQFIHWMKCSYNGNCYENKTTKEKKTTLKIYQLCAFSLFHSRSNGTAPHLAFTIYSVIHSAERIKWFCVRHSVGFKQSRFLLVKPKMENFHLKKSVEVSLASICVDIITAKHLWQSVDTEIINWRVLYWKLLENGKPLKILIWKLNAWLWQYMVCTNSNPFPIE